MAGEEKSKLFRGTYIIYFISCDGERERKLQAVIPSEGKQDIFMLFSETIFRPAPK